MKLVLRQAESAFFPRLQSPHRLDRSQIHGLHPPLAGVLPPKRSCRTTEREKN